MDTVGSLIDKMSIIEKRMEVSQQNKETVFELKTQMGWLLLEMAHCIIDGYTGSRPLSFKKHKVYDSSVKAFENMGVDGLLPLIEQLKKHNRDLWDLEDKRRDASLSDSERLAAADQVSVSNKKRNDTIDDIDSKIDIFINLIRQD